MASSLHKTAAYLLLLAGFSLPISIAGVNTLLPIITILTLLALWQQPLAFSPNPVAQTALALWLWMLLGVSYSLANTGAALLHLSHYLEFLYLPILLWVFREARWQRLGMHCFMIGILVILLGSYFVWLTGIPLGKATADNPVVFKNYITQGILFCMSAVLLFWYWQQYPRWRTLTVLVLVLLLFNVLFIGQGRTSYVIVLVLLLWFGFRWLGWRGLLLALLGASLLLSAAYQFSPSTHHRIQEIWDNIQGFHPDQPANTSVGYRLEFYQHSLKLIAQRPLWGTGTGGFAPAYAALTAGENRIASDNPHNEYLLIAVQWGIPGTLLFALFIGVLARYSVRLEAFALPAQGLLIIMLVGCLFNSLWLDFTEGHTFAYFIGLFYAGLKKENSYDCTIIK